MARRAHHRDRRTVGRGQGHDRACRRGTAAYRHIDTGAMYRAVAWKALQQGSTSRRGGGRGDRGRAAFDLEVRRRRDHGSMATTWRARSARRRSTRRPRHVARHPARAARADRAAARARDRAAASSWKAATSGRWCSRTPTSRSSWTPRPRNARAAAPTIRPSHWPDRRGSGSGHCAREARDRSDSTRAAAPLACAADAHTSRRPPCRRRGRRPRRWPPSRPSEPAALAYRTSSASRRLQPAPHPIDPAEKRSRRRRRMTAWRRTRVSNVADSSLASRRSLAMSCRCRPRGPVRSSGRSGAGRMRPASRGAPIRRPSGARRRTSAGRSRFPGRGSATPVIWGDRLYRALPPSRGVGRLPARAARHVRRGCIATS